MAVGEFYQVTGQLDKAHDSFQKATARNPKSTEARDRLIAFLIDTEKLDEAEQRTKAILEGNSKDISGRFFDGRLKVARGQMVEAIKVLLPLSNEQPRLPGPHHFLGMAYAAQANVSEAIKEFREAIRRDPNAFQSHVALGAAYLSKGDLDGSIEETQIALRHNPENVQAALLLGESYWRKGDTDKSKKVFEAIVKALPHHALAHYRIGLIARTGKTPRPSHILSRR
jgi:tetratricopeptide (TPR) repeat protein